MFKVTCVSILMALVIMMLPCQAGEITASLENYLSDVTAISADTAIQVIVMFDEQADIASLDKQLKQEKATLGERNRRVVQALKEVATKTQGTVAAYFDQLKSQGYITEYKTLWIANMAIVTANRDGIYAMADNMDIGEITLSYGIEGIKPVDEKPADNSLIASVECGLEAINAPAAWAAGYTGAGRIVANIDTGVDGYHPALADRFLGDTDNDGDYDESWLDPFDETDWDFPQDAYSHGTHTMGIICGRSADGDTIGVAIDAKWITSAAVDRDTSNLDGTIEDILESFQWMVDPDNNSETQDNPDVISNSWGLMPYNHADPCDETFWSVIDNVEAAGSVVIFAAGNEGETSSTMRSPADRVTSELNTFSVGAIDTYYEYDYLQVADFSSRGPSLCTDDGTLAIKPEITAPGVYVKSAIPDNRYAHMSGTSMATPHVAGAVALIRQANPDLDVDEVKEILLASAVDMGDIGPDNDYGQGYLDVYRACQLASIGISYVSGYVYDDETDSALAGALVTVEGSDTRVYTDDNGYYRILLRADSSFTITVSKYFYYTSTQTGIETELGETTTVNFELEKILGSVLYGYITDQDDNPAEDVAIIAMDTPLDTIYTDSDGYYIFENIAGSTTYTISSYSALYDYLNDTVYVAPADTARFDMEITQFNSFELADGGFVPEGALWELATPIKIEPYHDSFAWCTGITGYDAECGEGGCDNSLFSSTYYITDNDAVFSFYHWCHIDTGVDGGNVQISTDSGETWEILTPVGGYPYSSLEVLDNQPGFSGETTDWEFVEFELDGYAGEYVQFRFRFGSTGSTYYWYGWYIDGFAFDGAAIVAPDAEFSKTYIDVDVPSSGNITESITLSNNGLGDLEYETRIVTYPSRQNTLTTDEPQPQDEDDVIATIDGPDDYGYFLYDSDEAGGPEYNWIDISEVGTAVTFNGSDMMGCSDLISMGMPFVYYGEEKTAVTITTSGCVIFDTCSIFETDPINIPTQGDDYAEFIAVLWGHQSEDDGTCYYYHDSDENRFIVSWINWQDEMMPQGYYNFQVILNGDDNSIVMQYDNVVFEEVNFNIGIQSSDSYVGLEYSESLYGGLSDDFAIEFIYPLFWLSVEPTSGTIEAGSSQTLDITFDAADLPDNSYFGRIYFTTANDPFQTTHTIACSLGVGTVDVEEDIETVLPTALSLSQNYPNPFNPTTEILFNIPERGDVTLDVYDVLGRKVTTLVDEELGAGTHSVIWSGTNSSGDKVSSGIYFYKLSQNDNTTTKKMVLIK